MVGLPLRLRRSLALLLVLLLELPVAWALPPQQSSSQQTTSPGSTVTPLPTPIQGSNPPAPVKPQGSGITNTQQGQQQIKPPQAPVPSPAGVAAAPVVRAGGVPASEPSGAAIAPAKQKRRFSFALRIGLIVGAAIAVGAVAAASAASPSRAHTAP